MDAVPFERRCCEAFAQCIADALGIPEFVPKTPANQAAQVLTGLQPRKLPFRVLPEFKCIMKVASHVLPPLDAKQCTKADWCAQGICVPQGSKLLRPSFSDHGEGMEKAGLHAPHADDVLASPVPNLDLKKATVMSSTTSRTPPEPPKPKRIRVMSPKTDPPCSTSDPTPKRIKVMSSRTDPPSSIPGAPDAHDPRVPGFAGMPDFAEEPKHNERAGIRTSQPYQGECCPGAEVRILSPFVCRVGRV